MSRVEIETIIIFLVKDYCINNNISIEINSETHLIGENRILDSMGMVNLLVDIETSFLEAGYTITLVSEAAMSNSRSPFRRINTLCDFISKQIENK